jgi:hypothetical protein
MKTMHVGEFKAQFSDVLEWVKNGDMIRVVKGKSNELVGYFTLKSNENNKKEKRKLGQWKDENCHISKEFFETSEEDFDIYKN